MKLYYVNAVTTKRGEQIIELRDVIEDESYRINTATVLSKTGKQMDESSEGDLIFIENGRYRLADKELKVAGIAGVTAEGNVIIDSGEVLRAASYTVINRDNPQTKVKTKAVDATEMLKFIQAEDGGAGKGYALIHNDVVVDYTNSAGSRKKWKAAENRRYTYMIPETKESSIKKMTTFE